ncbi:MAG TPA: MEDS domain-containing protein [Candidatus Elarobacter sp.]|jgi:hypothetical protein|nr:MEDS domain-containing protein [Candidatus Elarobacter sp.]
MELDSPSQVHPAGAHIGYLFRDDEERRDVIRAFVRGGLNAGELVAYYADVREPELNHALEELGVLPVDEAHRHQLVTAPAASAYFPEQRFVPEHTLALVLDYYERGRRDFHNGARVVGEMSWASRGVPGSEQLTEYECRLNGLIAEHPVTVLCEYDMRCFDGPACFTALGLHPMLVIRGRIVPNPYLDAPGAPQWP